MSEELEVLKIVTERLESAGFAYMLTGSIALNYYAVPRMTRDIDLVVELSVDDAERLSGLFREDFYIDLETTQEAIRTRRAINIIHNEFVIKVDLVVRRDTPHRREEFARRRRVPLEGHEVFIVTPEDLIISKLDWARDSHSEVQLSDVQNLLSSVRGLDRDYLMRWTVSLGLDTLYRQAGG
jgi:hypothetical protein